jgi:thioredoxin 1
MDADDSPAAVNALSRRMRAAARTPGTLVVCLCADWCGTCRDYRPVFDRAADLHPSMRFDWLDIEDDAELVGELDIETFPTVLIADAEGVVFFGPLLPQPDHLLRLLGSIGASRPPRK